MRKKKSRVKISKLFILLFFLSFFAAIGKLTYVAISNEVDGINLTEFANNRNTVKKTLYASRGNIYDVHGDAIATNANSYTLIAYLDESRTTNPNKPNHVVDKEATAKSLSEILGMDYEYALGRLNTQGAYQVEFGIAGKNLSENKKVAIDSLDLPGISFIEGNKRYYKKSKMASYIVGYAKMSESGEIVGEMGIEGLYNNILKGTDGHTEYERDAYGYQMGEANTTEPISGSDIYLTLDTQIQLILEDAVHTLEENNHFTWFTFTVMNAKTGAIVGSASSPNFNPNTLEGLTNYVNPLVGYTYEPGSTMKIFSWLAAMENGVYNGAEEFMSGSIKVEGATISDFNNTGWGTITYDRGFAYSSNVGATNLALKMGGGKLHDFYESLGFGQKTGIELPGEESGLLRDLSVPSELATSSFGQGITTTPIQNLQALTILTNDGVMLKPYIVDKIVDQNGNITYQGQRTELGQKVSTSSVERMHKLMYDVVYNGLSKYWQPNNITIMGKTGTAQIAGSHGYLTGSVNYIRSFAGIFPYENPEYIFYVSAKQIDGGAAAVAKVVTKAVESIANYANITNIATELDLSKLINLTNYISNDMEFTFEELERKNLKVIKLGSGKTVINQYPPKNTNVLQGSKVFLLSDTKDYIMPDMAGWSSSEVMNFCNLIGLKYNFNGYGVVSSTNINPGEVINVDSALEVTLNLNN